MIMQDQVTAQERLLGLVIEEIDYLCDSCEEPIHKNDESFEVRYGFICKKCAGH